MKKKKKKWAHSLLIPGLGRHLARPIQDIHKEIANKKGFPQDSFSLPDDTRAYWLCKNKDAEKTLVWFHGLYSDKIAVNNLHSLRINFRLIMLV